jgi:sterol desaturase/sphingolipid hydroxylase (fatty acid hydroxylase superfamily)
MHAANDIGHPLQAFYSLMFIGLPLSIIQVDGPAIPFAVGMFVSMLSFYIHSPIELHFGPLRKVIVDNRFHRIHHSLEERHFDKNFGICLSIWDHMFGTAYEPGDEWPKVGLAEIPAPRTIGDYLAIPFRRKPRESDAPVTGPLSREA